MSEGIGYLSIKSSQSQVAVHMLLKKLGQPGYEVDSSGAYERAVDTLRKLKRGYITIDRVFTSIETIDTAFVRVADDWISGIEGAFFYWCRRPSEPLILFGGEFDEDPIEICRADVPESWIGCGFFKRMWPKFESDESNESKEKSDVDDDALLILWLASDNPDHFSSIVKEEAEQSVFLAGIHLKPVNATRFYDYCARRFRDIR